MKTLVRMRAEPLASLEVITHDMATFGAGAAIGLALCPAEANDLETLLKRADADMDARKRARGAAP